VGQPHALKAGADYPRVKGYQVRQADSWGERLAAVIAVAIIVATISVRGAGEPGLESLARLKAGNARFVADASEALPITAPRRTALAGGQTPFATVLSCADSRVPPEVVFHTGLGDLFVVRSAGHVADKSVLASLEYGAEHLHTPILVVMGHEMCGAVKAASETPDATSLGPNLDYMLKAIRPAVARAKSHPADARLRAAILENVEETINTLLESSSVLRDLAESKRMTIVGAYYELASGRAHFSEPVSVPPRTGRSVATSHHPAAGASATRPAAAKEVKPAASAPTGHAPAAPAAAPTAPAAAKPAAAKTTPAAPAKQSTADADAKAATTVAPAKPAAPKPH
jgi:carbonic anhydrase